MNVTLLKKVKRAILREPKRLCMYYWLDVDPTPSRAPSCGTVGCIAGWTAILAKRKSGSIRLTAHQFIGGATASVVAECALKLSHGQARRLFHLGEWPVKLGEEYENARTHRQHAQIAAKRIDLFIKTKGAR